MCYFVKLIVHNFTKIDKHVLLQLNFSCFIYLHSRSVNNTHVSDEVLTIFADNHKLTFPKLLVIRNLIVVCLTLSNFEHSLITFE